MFSSYFYPVSRDFNSIFEDFTKEAFKQADSYPVYNIFYKDEDEGKVGYIEVAVTGLGEENLKVYDEDGFLVIEGEYPEEGKREYINRGLSRKNFKRKFKIEKYDVDEISVENGLMTIRLTQKENNKRLIPFNKKLKQLEG